MKGDFSFSLIFDNNILERLFGVTFPYLGLDESEWLMATPEGGKANVSPCPARPDLPAAVLPPGRSVPLGQLRGPTCCGWRCAGKGFLQETLGLPEKEGIWEN